MFKENKEHLQQDLFNNLSTMDSRLTEKLQKSWAALFYKHVFCNINENSFAPLYCGDNGRPNFPVNILMGLDLIKEIRGYTDEVLLDEYAYNFQISYALGLRTLGERYFAPRTLYEFRARLYNYSLEHPEEADIIFAQFENLTDHFIKAAKLSTDEARMDSTQVMSNIKLAGRLSLAYDVLVNGIKALPEALLNDALKLFLKSDYKTQFLYKLKGKDSESRIQVLIQYCAEIVQLAHGQFDLKTNPVIELTQRFLTEQATFNEKQNLWIAKDNKEISAKSLQSAYDPDATYRNKNGKKHVGFVLNLTETCADENPVQMVTHYDLASNITSDTELLKEDLPVLNKKGVKNLYTDGAYYSPDIIEEAKAKGIEIHYTDMTGRKKFSDKLPYNAFEIENKEKILRCPAGQEPIRAEFNEKDKTLSAHFNREICAECPHKEKCRVGFRKTDTVVRVNQKTLIAGEIRLKIEDKEQRREATSKRAAIEGTNSTLKRAQGLDKLSVRGIIKSTLAVGTKLIAHNFRQLTRFFNGDIRKKVKESLKLDQGIPVTN